MGVKTGGKGWGVNAAVFRTNIADLQVTLDAGSCSSRISFNVPKASTTGLEIEATKQATNNLLFTFAGTFVQAEFDSTVLDSGGNVVGGVQSGNRLASVPELSFAVAATYEFSDTLFGSNKTYI